MRNLILAVALIASSLGFSQGIQFETGSWGEALQKAKDLNKPLFVDVYTTWCGPCKRMAKEIFPVEEVGKYYNEHFICYQIDAEKGEGLQVAKLYDVHSYPTFIFVKGDGTLFYRSLGSMPAADFVAVGQAAMAELSDSKSLADWDKEYASGKKDADFLYAYMQKRSALQMDNSELFGEYLKAIPSSELYSDKVFELYKQEQFNLKVGTVPFQNMLEHVDGYFQKMSFATYNYLYGAIIGSIRTAARSKDEALLEASLAAYDKLPANDNAKTKDELRLDYYKRAKDNAKYMEMAVKLADKLMKISMDSIDRKDALNMQALEARISSGKMASAGLDPARLEKIRVATKDSYRKSLAQSLNEYAWSVFELSSAKEELKKALAWSDKSLKLDAKNPSLMDTYANILYKLGDKKKAIQVEEEAMGLVDAASAKSYQETLDKMKSGL